MKLNPEYILRNVAGEQVVVPTGSASQKINGLITLNDSAAFLWECVAKGLDRKEIVAKVMEEFETDETAVTQDVNGFLDMLLEEGFATEEES